ncbi:S8 family peptidase [Ammoniphilus sp. CFH 90114]|uniref:S8 family peptidase n=1 Tax=Ammoniphilus sp. CFH 90114 TaxID=2493665 RepID=UPI00100E7334|nr:S8 family peptidase [Ammoniphilus sp. CFH 90114]RXT08824.1 serine protease [Ammoniphilus sp. CFH 90114]
MFGFSMVQLVRRHGDKIDYTLRKELVNLYRPFRWTPCFLHGLMEGRIKRLRAFPVIIEFEGSEGYEKGLVEVHDTSQKHTKCHIKKSFASTNCCSAQMTPQAIEALLENCNHIRKIHMDREVRALLNVAKPSVRSDQVVNPSGVPLTGKGVTIAVIDTGIHPHPDLEGRIVDFVDLVGTGTNPYDDNGHGTHCAGDAAGNGAASGGNYAGPAPDAYVIGVKVLDKLGSGSLSTVMDGVQWCIDYNNNPNTTHKINIISMSLGSAPDRPAKDDPMVQMVEAAWREGIVVLVAAGNDGPSEGTISSPGNSPVVITVGAMDDRNTPSRDDDDVASFSSRGPTPFDNHPKPDILAPGVNIISLRAPNSYLDKLQKASRREQNYFELSGTSMATPICAGAAAQLLELKPNLTPDQVKKYLMKGATPWGNREGYIYGAGYLDVKASVELIEEG